MGSQWCHLFSFDRPHALHVMSDESFQATCASKLVASLKLSVWLSVCDRLDATGVERQTRLLSFELVVLRLAWIGLSDELFYTHQQGSSGRLQLKVLSCHARCCWSVGRSSQTDTGSLVCAMWRQRRLEAARSGRCRYQLPWLHVVLVTAVAGVLAVFLRVDDDRVLPQQLTQLPQTCPRLEHINLSETTAANHVSVNASGVGGHGVQQLWETFSIL